ncbi:MAG: hypothetical protein Q9190_002148 [Brigantiaea leucoxantha]
MLHRTRSIDIQNQGQGTAPTLTGTGELARPSLPNLRARSSPLKFLASSTAKTGTSKEAHRAWERDYLNDLRSNCPPRPNGSRPLPDRNSLTDGLTLETPMRTSSAMSGRVGGIRQPSPTKTFKANRASSTLSHQQTAPSRFNAGTPPSVEDPQSISRDQVGRPIVREPQPGSAAERLILSGSRRVVVPSGTYQERSQRAAEKEEARSLREALEAMDVEEEERLHNAAQDEASMLVWRHTYPESSYRNPADPYFFHRPDKHQNHTRSQSDDRYTRLRSSKDAIKTSQRPTPPETDPRRNPECSVSQEDQNDFSDDKEQVVDYNRVSGRLDDDQARSQTAPVGHSTWNPSKKKDYVSLTFSLPRVKPSGRRRSSASRFRNISGSLFRNPDDKIYEELDDLGGNHEFKTGNTVKNAIRHHSSRFRSPNAEGSKPEVTEHGVGASNTDIHCNPPSQSRYPFYTTNTVQTPAESASLKESHLQQDQPGFRNGVEIRSDEIRAATSMRMKDRSPKLPSPTVVSDSCSRPIVSFDKDWKAPEIKDTKESVSSEKPTHLRSKPQLPDSVSSAPIVPTISILDIPDIRIDESSAEPIANVPSVPSISVSTPEVPKTIVSNGLPSYRPLPRPSKHANPRTNSRPLPHHSSTAPVPKSSRHWSPALHRRATAQCAACALPISGRIVSAASQRFHPECFSCFLCQELLECVAFYPEPDNFRNDRLARIEARASGLEVQEEAGKLVDDDGDESLRFYCHLDFHEQFSPRCRSCKTPIEGEVVIACGGEWHVGHFFCAQCGDPFDAKTPFVEKDGYAWCVGCHTNRFSGKCKGCKKPVIDLVVRALGGEWHEDCFSCKV